VSQTNCFLTFLNAADTATMRSYDPFSACLFQLYSNNTYYMYINKAVWFTDHSNSKTSSDRPKPMHGSTNIQSPSTFAEIHCSCDKIYHKQEVRFLLYIVGQIVT